MSDTSENTALELDFIRFILESLVSHPEDIEIAKSIDTLGTLINLKLNKEDMGRVIGKKGHTIKSIRTLLRVIGAKQNERITLKILEPNEN